MLLINMSAIEKVMGVKGDVEFSRKYLVVCGMVAGKTKIKFSIF